MGCSCGPSDNFSKDDNKCGCKPEEMTGCFAKCVNRDNRDVRQCKDLEKIRTNSCAVKKKSNN